MFGPDYTLGACPGCTGLGDGLDGTLVHLSHRDVTLLCFSRAPIARLTAYKRRMGWQFPYVSTYNTDFAFDFGLALTQEQAQQASELKEMIDNAPGWLQEWSGQIGAELKDGLRENPSWIAFARENGTVRWRRPQRSWTSGSRWSSTPKMGSRPPGGAAERPCLHASLTWHRTAAGAQNESLLVLGRAEARSPEVNS